MRFSVCATLANYHAHDRRTKPVEPFMGNALSEGDPFLGSRGGGWRWPASLRLVHQGVLLCIWRLGVNITLVENHDGLFSTPTTSRGSRILKSPILPFSACGSDHLPWLGFYGVKVAQKGAEIRHTAENFLAEEHQECALPIKNSQHAAHKADTFILAAMREPWTIHARCHYNQVGRIAYNPHVPVVHFMVNVVVSGRQLALL